MDSEGPIGSNLTSFESQLASTPGSILNYVKTWPQRMKEDNAEHARVMAGQESPWEETTHALGKVNPVVSNEEGIDYGATAANLLPLAIDLKGGGITESPLGRIASSSSAKLAGRLAARSGEAVINQKLVPLRPILNINTPADEAAATHFKVPGRDWGLDVSEPPPAPRTASTPPVKYSTRIVEPEAATPPPSIKYSTRIMPQEMAPQPSVPIKETAQPGTAGSMAKSILSPIEQTAPADTSKLGDLLNEGLNGKVPEGHTPLKSSAALSSYKYDPAAREFEAVTKSGQHYIYGDVAPEVAAKFESAPSKGKAWAALRNTPGVTPVGTVVNGTRMGTKPPVALRSATPGDLAPEWQKALDDVKARKSARSSSSNQ